MNGEPPERDELIRLTALIEILIPTAERIDGTLVVSAGLCAPALGVVRRARHRATAVVVD